MLQQKQITKVLTQGLKEVEIDGKKVGPILVSLLADNGVPLCTVCRRDNSVSMDNIKIYSLLGFNNLGQQAWTALHVDEEIRVMIGRVERRAVVIIYDRSIGDGIVKVKLDNLVKVLGEGLKGEDGEE